MRIERRILRSRVARRIFVLFIICAVIPIAALAFLAFGLVSGQLQEQSQRRLHQAARTVGLALYERLLFLDAEADRFLLRRSGEAGGARVALIGELRNELLRRFVGLARVGRSGESDVLLGALAPVELGARERDGLSSGKTVLFTRISAEGSARVFLAKALGAQATGDLLLAEVAPGYLWGAGEGVPLPAVTELCVLDPGGRVLMCTLPISAQGLQEATQRETHSGAKQFRWSSEDEAYLAAAWPIFMPSRFASRPWTVVVSESERSALASLDYFRMVFPLVVLLSLWLVTLFSLRLIRRSLVPLDRLQEGTRRIATGQFDSRVAVTSRDEFEELAGSFNRMAEQLGRQFHTLASMTEITQVVLSSLETTRVVETVLARMADVSPCDRIGVILTSGPPPAAARLYLQDPTGARAAIEEPVQLEAQDGRELEAARVLLPPALPGYLASLGQRGIRSCVLLPIALRGRLAAVIVLGYRADADGGERELGPARQLADQVAVALANARLVEELDQLSWGTLRALARAIDAKSPWTAGHSERVTSLAIEIGRAMGLGPKELDVMQRAGLLHDIGKIGTPPGILDKPGRLTDDELKVMREHAQVGASILAPIAAYAEVIPVVRQHHERYDGRGYPDGLAGQAIDLRARIFSVADVYDALRSDRPYRTGQDRQTVVDYIRAGSGTQFDPEIVEVFCRVVANRPPEGVLSRPATAGGPGQAA
jgi:putative nucleotidyltransferase with HDIG domain